MPPQPNIEEIIKRFDERYLDIDKCSLITPDGSKPSDNLKSFIQSEINKAYTSGFNTAKERAVECDHDWQPCNQRICTSDLHTHHCTKCNKHKFQIQH